MCPTQKKKELARPPFERAAPAPKRSPSRSSGLVQNPSSLGAPLRADVRAPRAPRVGSRGPLTPSGRRAIRYVLEVVVAESSARAAEVCRCAPGGPSLLAKRRTSQCGGGPSAESPARRPCAWGARRMRPPSGDDDAERERGGGSKHSQTQLHLAALASGKRLWGKPANILETHRPSDPASSPDAHHVCSSRFPAGPPCPLPPFDRTGDMQCRKTLCSMPPFRRQARANSQNASGPLQHRINFGRSGLNFGRVRTKFADLGPNLPTSRHVCVLPPSPNTWLNSGHCLAESAYFDLLSTRLGPSWGDSVGGWSGRLLAFVPESAASWRKPQTRFRVISVSNVGRLRPNSARRRPNLEQHRSNLAGNDRIWGATAAAPPSAAPQVAITGKTSHTP